MNVKIVTCGLLLLSISLHSTTPTPEQRKEATHLLARYPALARQYPQLTDLAIGATKAELIELAQQSDKQTIQGKVISGAKIAASTTAALIGYAGLHNTVTFNRCPNYFLKGRLDHKVRWEWSNYLIANFLSRILSNTKNGPLHILSWAAVGNLKVGLCEGAILAAAAQVGPWPTFDGRKFKNPALATVGSMALGALGIGWAAHYSFRDPQKLEEFGQKRISSRNDLTVFHMVPKSNWRACAINTRIDSGAYIAGFCAGIALPAYVLYTRYKLKQKYEQRAQKLVASGRFSGC